MVIKVQIRDCGVKRVLVDPGSSTNVMYWEAFKGMDFDPKELLPFNGTLVGFSGEQVQVLGYLLVLTTFGTDESAKDVRVRYLVVNAYSPYNIIIGRPSFNALEAILSNLYLTMKYSLGKGRVGIIRG